MVNELCEHNDIVVLQETCLLLFDTSLRDSVISKFRLYSISAEDTYEPLLGRSYGGVSDLWRKDHVNCIDLFTIICFEVYTNC